jgi:hypothetical protein
MGHLFAEDIDLDLYALIRSTSLARVFEYVRARETMREMALEAAELAAETAPTEAPSSDTIPVSYIAPTSRPAKLAG